MSVKDGSIFSLKSLADFFFNLFLDSLISLFLEKVLDFLNVFLVFHYLSSFFFFFLFLLWRPQLNFLVMKKKKPNTCLSVCTVRFTQKGTSSPNMRYLPYAYLLLEYSKKYQVILCIWRLFFFLVVKNTTQPTVMPVCSFSYYRLSLKLWIISRIFRFLFSLVDFYL